MELDLLLTILKDYSNRSTFNSFRECANGYAVLKRASRTSELRAHLATNLEAGAHAVVVQYSESSLSGDHRLCSESNCVQQLQNEPPPPPHNLRLCIQQTTFIIMHKSAAHIVLRLSAEATPAPHSYSYMCTVLCVQKKLLCPQWSAAGRTVSDNSSRYERTGW